MGQETSRKIVEDPRLKEAVGKRESNNVHPSRILFSTS